MIGAAGLASQARSLRWSSALEPGISPGRPAIIHRGASLMANTDGPQTKVDPLWSIAGDPVEIREAARRVWDACQEYLAAGGLDDGRIEPLRKVFAQNDEDMLRAAIEVKWKELGPGQGQSHVGAASGDESTGLARGCRRPGRWRAPGRLGTGLSRVGRREVSGIAVVAATARGVLLTSLRPRTDGCQPSSLWSSAAWIRRLAASSWPTMHSA